MEKIKIYPTTILLIPYIKGRTQTEDFWERGVDENIWN
jgi:hypothetical protein